MAVAKLAQSNSDFAVGFFGVANVTTDIDETKYGLEGLKFMQTAVLLWPRAM